jgi:hypothetical protein
MDNAQQWAMIVAFFAPLVIAVVNQPGWTKFRRTSVMVAASVLIGLGTSYFAGDFSDRSIVSCILIGMTVTISAYKGLFEPTGIAAAIERATSPGQQSAARRAGR